MMSPADVDGEILRVKELLAGDQPDALRPWIPPAECACDTSSMGASILPIRSISEDEMQDPDLVVSELGEPVLLPPSALADWSLHALALPALRHTLGHKQLCIKGTDDDGDPVRVDAYAFVQYMVAQDDPGGSADEEPLSVFDDDVLYDFPPLRALYTVPEAALQLGEGLLDRLPPPLQPPLRWFIMGPSRSGSPIHQDPTGTSAWNVVTHGRKRWAMLPPGVPADLVERDEQSAPSTTMAYWFEVAWPKICAAAAAAGWAGRDFEQGAGQLVYVPPGWWHAVINLESSVAITHNSVQAGALNSVLLPPLASSTSSTDQGIWQGEEWELTCPGGCTRIFNAAGADWSDRDGRDSYRRSLLTGELVHYGGAVAEHADGSAGLDEPGSGCVSDAMVATAVEAFKLCRNRGRECEPSLTDFGTVKGWLAALQKDGLLRHAELPGIPSAAAATAAAAAAAD